MTSTANQEVASQETKESADSLRLKRAKELLAEAEFEKLPELEKLNVRRNRGEFGGATGTVDTSKKFKIETVPLADIVTIPELNPREDFTDIDPLKRDLFSNGQQTPVDLYRASGEALKRVNRFAPKVTGETWFVGRGHRRVKAISELQMEWDATHPDDARFGTIIVIRHEKVLNTLRDLAETYGDQVNRTNAETRYEKAKLVAMYRDAGFTLDAVATMFGQSVGWVQTMERVMRLPNNDEYPILSELKKYDLAVAAERRGKMTKDDVAACIQFPNNAVTDLDKSFRYHKLGEKKLRSNETQPEDFDKLWMETVETKGHNFDAAPGEMKTVKAEIVREIRSRVISKGRADVKDAMKMVCDIALGDLTIADLETFLNQA